jgi:hypothetical protein
MRHCAPNDRSNSNARRVRSDKVSSRCSEESQFARRSPTRSALRRLEARPGNGPSRSKVAGRARYADAHAGAVANATMPRHRRAITGFRTSRSARLSLQRARSYVSPRSSVAVHSNRPGWRMSSARAVGVKELAASRLGSKLALRARPRPPAKSRELAAHPSLALRCARAPRNIAALVRRRPSLTPDLNRHVHSAFADAPQTARPLRCVPGADSVARQAKALLREHGIRCRPRFARRKSSRRVSGATHAGERGPRAPNEPAADCEQSLRLRCSFLRVCAFAD